MLKIVLAQWMNTAFIIYFINSISEAPNEDYINQVRSFEKMSLLLAVACLLLTVAFCVRTCRFVVSQWALLKRHLRTDGGVTCLRRLGASLLVYGGTRWVSACACSWSSRR